jgi:PAS domain S-box-containing protein/putative nucleotidyltransferase with HDIG domain
MILDLSDRTVLLVEDNPGDARLIAESLRDAGSRMRLVTVDTLAAALHTLENDQIDAVILDLGLPDSQGLDTFAQLQAAAPDVATLILSGDSDNRTALSAVQEGAQDFLVKGHADGETLVRSIGYAIERKRAETALAESEEKFRYIFDRSVVGKSLTGMDGTFEPNAALCAMLGYSPEELADGTTWRQVTYPDDVAEMQRHMDDMLAGTIRSARHERRFVRKDGTIIWADISSSLRRDRAGQPLYFMTSALDITERKRITEDLRVSEEHLRHSLEVAESLAEFSRVLVAARQSIKEIAVLCLDYALALTASDYGYVSHIDQETGANVILAATSMMPGTPATIDPGSMSSPGSLPEAGRHPHLWGVSLNTARTFFTNSPATEPDSTGVPEGHMPLTSFLSVPVATGAGLVGQIAVANALEGYSAESAAVVERLASLYAVAIVNVEEHEALMRSEEDLRTSNDRLQHMIRDVAEVMGSIIETRDPYTQGHQVRVAGIANSLAVEMGLSGDDLDCIQMAGLLHDIGKLSVPAEILSKPGQLSDVEFALIREHPLRGHDILSRISFPWPIADIVVQHHERCDGSGYPAGLKGDEIMLPAAILAVADVLEAMASFRPYRASLGAEAAVAEISGHPEKYCPQVVAATVALYERGELGV